jgi:hypothetical protein
MYSPRPSRTRHVREIAIAHSQSWTRHREHSTRGDSPSRTCHRGLDKFTELPSRTHRRELFTHGDSPSRNRHRGLDTFAESPSRTRHRELAVADTPRSGARRRELAMLGDPPTRTRHHGLATRGDSPSRTRSSQTRHRGLACYIDYFWLNAARLCRVGPLRCVDYVCHIDCFQLNAAPEKAICFSSKSLLLFTFVAPDTQGLRHANSPYISSTLSV